MVRYLADVFRVAASDSSFVALLYLADWKEMLLLHIHCL